jgi:hypothetical protein
VNGVTYWLDRLRPYAAQGFRRGVLTATTVVLYREDGAQVVLPRPGRWWTGPDLDRVLEEQREDFDAEAAAALRALWQIEPGEGE